MKCPYQTKVTHKGYGVELAEDITQFGECLKNECPFYYTKKYNERNTTEHCHKAESEAHKNGV